MQLPLILTSVSFLSIEILFSVHWVALNHSAAQRCLLLPLV